MEIKEEKIKEVNVLTMKGRLDTGSAKAVKEKIGMLTKKNCLNIIIDMGDVNFIDSSGLGSLIASLRSVNKLGGDIKISSLQDPVRVIFELTRLHQVFEIFDDKNTAIESFR